MVNLMCQLGWSMVPKNASNIILDLSVNLDEIKIYMGAPMWRASSNQLKA